MMKKAFPLVVIAVLLVVFALWWRMGTQPHAPSTTFEECVAAGNPVMESYPRQCRDGNNTFVEDVGTTPPPVACTMEAKICPDGSAVGRTGPKCEFAPCPTSTGGGILPYNSGIRGTVLLGPTCPVMRDPPDPQCADKPYQTTVTISRASSPALVFATAQSAADGTFAVSLPPGEYVVGAKGGATLPRCAQTPATVGASGYTQITVSCDTGIR